MEKMAKVAAESMLMKIRVYALNMLKSKNDPAFTNERYKPH